MAPKPRLRPLANIQEEADRLWDAISREMGDLTKLAAKADVTGNPQEVMLITTRMAKLSTQLLVLEWVMGTRDWTQ